MMTMMIYCRKNIWRLYFLRDEEESTEEKRRKENIWSIVVNKKKVNVGSLFQKSFGGCRG